MHKHTILAFMQDRQGVLNKIAMLLRRKMYNVDTLTVCKTENTEISRMTITIRTDDPQKVQHIIRQIVKLPEVISAQDLDPESSFWREVALLKLKLLPSKLETLKQNYDFKILSEKNKYLVVQIAGTERYIDAFLGEVGMKNILEVARTGVTAMQE